MLNKIITGNTPTEKYLLDGQEIYLKREDKNPSGSFKDRIIAHEWESLREYEEVVLSSSGNLAISLLHWLKLNPCKLRVKIFTNGKLNEYKQSKLDALVNQIGPQVTHEVSQQAKSAAIKYSRNTTAFLLRNSSGETYPKAYFSMVDEIINFEEAKKIKFSAVFVCASSGTAALGMLMQLKTRNRELPLYIVQTSYIHPIAGEIAAEIPKENTTIANAISDRVAHRKQKILNLLKENNGGAVVCSNLEIEKSLKILKSIDNNSHFSGNSALSLAGFFKLSEKGYNFPRPLIIISGN